MRITMELSGVLVFVFTIGSILGPILGVLLIGAAQLFGYRYIPHYYCPDCRTAMRE